MVEAILQNSSFWILISTLVCVWLLVKYGRAPILSMLDDRTQRVVDRLDEAESLLSEARTLLATYERKHIEAMEEAENIVTEARIKADRLSKKSEKQLMHAIDRLENTAKTRLEKTRKDAELSVREHLTEQSVHKAKELLKNDAKKLEKATEVAIDNALESFAEKYHQTV